MTSSLSKKVGLAALIMMASVLLSRVIGLLREMVIARYGGAAGEVDAYNIAFIIPEILNHVVASGFLSVTFIPIFSKYLAEQREEEGWRVFSAILSVFGLFLTALIVLAWLLAPWLVPLCAPGIEDVGILRSAIRMTRIILPAQLFFFAGGLLMAVQFAKEQFKLPALAPLVYNLGIIAGGILLYRWVRMEGFAWGAITGAFLGNFLIQHCGARRAGMRFAFNFDLRHPDLKKYVVLTLPLMLGLTMTFSTEFFARFFGSYLPEGGVAAINYALRVMFILVGFFGQAAGVASFPYLSRLAAENKMREMNLLLNDTLRRYIALVIPFSALLIVLRHEVIFILFQRGRFDALATARTAEALAFLLIGAFAFAAQTVVVRGYYAVQNTLFPTLIGTLAVAASLPLYWLGVREWGNRGLTLAIAISAILQVIFLYALWQRRSDTLNSNAVYAFFAKIMLVSAAIGSLVYWLKASFLSALPQNTFAGNLLLCAIIATVFFAAFVGMGFLFRIPEIVGVVRRVLRR
jgi:putative peptidoglycan lipid II flippase